MTGAARLVRTRAGALLAIAAAAGTGGPTGAAETRSVVVSPAELGRGSVEGLAVSRAGRLFRAPALRRVDGADGLAAQVWAVVSDPAGGLWLGTGPEGRVLRAAGGGPPTPAFRVPTPLVTALARTRDDRLIAGTAPEGFVFRETPDGQLEPWSATGELYVWSLVATPEGRVYAGTGERGRVVEILRSGEVDLLFDSAEAHIVSLLALPDGNLLAGGAGRGLVYRLDPEGHALVLHDDDLPEVSALAVAPDGTVYAALLAPAEAESRPPALRLRLPQAERETGPGEAVALLEETTLRGVIEGWPGAPEPAPERPRGRVVRIDRDGSVTPLWESASEAPFCLLVDRSGRVLFGTGEPARLYRVEPEGDVALLATLREAQVTALHDTGAAVWLATSNPAAIYSVEDGAVDAAAFTSRPIDAGGPARWGSIRWRVERPGGRTEFYTRTGNSREPDATWSAWSPALTEAAGSPVVNPDGRYLQWRARQAGEGGQGASLSDVTVVYEPYNRPPEIGEFRLDRPVSTPPRGAVALRWTTRDPDGDPLEVVVEYREREGEAWRTAATRRTERGAAEWAEGRWDWATAELPEGEYEVRLRASDGPGNAPDDGRTAGPPDPVLRVTIDRTPPSLTVSSRADGSFDVRADDALSAIARLELLHDGVPRFAARPLDGVHDGRSERFVVALPAGAGWTLRGTDAAGNTADRALPAR